MTRAEKIRRMLAHAAAAKALRTMLENEAENEAEEGTRVTWNIPGVAAFASLEHDGALIADPEAFMDYLEQNHPTEVVRREIREVRAPQWLAARLEEWAALGPVLPAEDALPDELPGIRTQDGTVVPGLKFKRGGAFRSLTIKPDSIVARRLAVQARRYVLGVTPLEALEASIAGEPDE